MWYISQFDVEILHIQGEQNVIADYISRSTVPEDTTELDTELDIMALPLMLVQPLKPTATSIPNPAQLTEATQALTSQELQGTYASPTGLHYSIRTNKLFIPPIFRNSIIYWSHAGRYSQHRGINGTTRHIKTLFWWPNIHQDVTTFIAACLPCNRNRPPVHPTLTGVLSRPHLFDLISIDTVGPRHLTAKTTVHYYCLIDHCSRFVVTLSSKFITDDLAITVIRDHWLPYFGAPRLVISDNASIFQTQSFITFITSDLQATLMPSSPYYPQGNSINESCHQSLEHGLSIRTQQEPSVPFRHHLRQVTLAYNSAYQSSIRNTPFAILVSRSPILPGLQSLTAETPESERYKQLLHQDRIRQLTPHLPPASSTLPPHNIKTGDFVLYYRSPYEISTAEGRLTKYSPSWSLPCRVEFIHDNQLTLREYGSGRRRKAPVSRCRKLPVDVPSELLPTNLEHIRLHLPLTKPHVLNPSLLPPQYSITTSIPEITITPPVTPVPKHQPLRRYSTRSTRTIPTVPFAAPPLSTTSPLLEPSADDQIIEVVLEQNHHDDELPRPASDRKRRRSAAPDSLRQGDN